MAITLSSQGVVSGSFGTFTVGMGHGTTNFYSATVIMKLDESGPFDFTTLMPSSGGSVGISGTLPAFASTPTFTISGSLPAFGAVPTFNLGTLNGAATAALQTTLNTTLGTPMQQTGGSVTVVGTVPLPSGAATSAAQASTLTQVTTSATALGAPADTAWVSGSGSVIALLKKIAGVGGAVTIADGASTVEGTTTDAAWSGSGASTIIAALKAIYAKVAGVIGVSQSGTWTVQPGNTANTTAWKVDGSAVTQPVSGLFYQATQPISAATLPLPAGAATAAGITTLNTTLGTPMQQTGGSIASVGSGSFATAQVSVGTSATLLAASRAGRNAITIINEGAVVTRLGIVGVTTSTGSFMAGVIGTSVTIPTQAAVYGVVASGTNPVSVIETF